MRKWVLMLGVVSVWTLLHIGASVAEHEPVKVEKVESEGVVLMSSERNRYVTLLREDGKRVALEVTDATQILLNGQLSGFEVLDQLKPNRSIVKAVHHTNDAGMQEALKLDITRLE